MTVSITVPMRADVLAATAVYFERLAQLAAPVETLEITGSTVYDGVYTRPVPPASEGTLNLADQVCGVVEQRCGVPAPEPPTDGPIPDDAEIPEPAQRDAIQPPPPPDRDVDSAGEEYDPRIHSSSHSFVRGGTWKLKRGIDPVYVTAVRSGNVPPVAAAPVPAPPPPIPERPAAAVDFAGLMTEASKRYGSGSIAKLNEIAKSIGVNGFAFLATDPANLATAWELLTNE